MDCIPHLASQLEAPRFAPLSICPFIDPSRHASILPLGFRIPRLVLLATFCVHIGELIRILETKEDDDSVMVLSHVARASDKSE